MGLGWLLGVLLRPDDKCTICILWDAAGPTSPYDLVGLIENLWWTSMSQIVCHMFSVREESLNSLKFL